MSAVDRLLEHLEGVQERNNGFWSLCPAHDDHNPSLHIQKGDDGRALVVCRAGCEQAEVMAALERRGLKRSDLFASKRGASVVPLDGRSKASRSPSKGRERLVKSYHVKDEAGRLCGIHERWENPETPDEKSFKWKLPNGRYSHGDISPAAMPLFGAEHLANWPKNYRVVLCEGETPTAALRSRNIKAVGTVCGAKLIPDARALEVLRGRPVVVWGDGDPLGQKHAERLARALRGVAASVQLYEWTDPPEGVKGPDAADHPAVRSGDREEVKALVRELRDAPEANIDHDQVPALRDRMLLGRIMREGVEPPEELVQDVLLAGKVHSLYSAASTGKTFLMLWLVLRVLEQGLRVLIFDRENGHRIMAERLEALGADPERVDELLYYSFYSELPTTEEGLLDYENTLDEVKPALVVFDSLIGFLAANGLDENSSNDVSIWATHYAHPARSRGTAVLLLDHVPKEGVSSRGSSRKRDEVDVMWALRNPLPFDRDTVGRLVIHREKDREGWLPDNVGFSVGGGEDGFVFARSLATVEAKGDDGLTKSARVTLEALGSLEEKGATTAEWEKAASGMGVSRSSFYRAKRNEAVKNRIFLQNERYYLKGATGAKQVPRDPMTPAPEEVPLVPPPLGVGPNGTGGDIDGQEDDYSDLRDMFAADEKGAS